MDSINEILSQKNFSEPPESVAIRKYIQTQFQAKVNVITKKDTITISSSNASLANTLRLNTTKLQTVAQTSKKLIFRIG